jgi:hypothetical protein
MIPGILPQEVLTMGGWSHSLSDDELGIEAVPDKLWRTLVANKDLEGHSPEGDFKLCCLYSLQREDVSGDVRIRELMVDPNCPENVLSFLKRVQDVVWNRKAFTAGLNNELFGLCPKSAQEGDLLCILYGCSVPVVLRRLTEMPSSGLRPGVKNTRTPRGTRSDARATSHASGDQNRDPMPSSDEHDNLVPDEDNPWTEGGATQSPEDQNSVADENEQTERASKEPPPETEDYPALSDGDQAPEQDVPETVASEYYQLIGECYVDGRMDGEAIDHEDYMVSAKDFTLV